MTTTTMRVPRRRRRRGLRAVTRRSAGRFARTWLVAVLALAALALVVARTAAAQTTRGITLDQIAENPIAYYGQTVTIAAEVDMVLSPRAFTVEDDDFLFDDEIMVVTAQPLPAIDGRWDDAAVLEDDIVMLTGIVQALDFAKIEQQIGVDLDEELFTYWTGKSAIVASAVTVTPRKPGPITEDVDEVIQNPAAHHGRPVVVRAPVGEVLGPRAFTLEGDDPSGDALLIVAARPREALDGRLRQAPLAEGDAVVVRGPARRFDLAEFERLTDSDLDDELFRDWQGKPAMIARSLRLVSES